MPGPGGGGSSGGGFGGGSFGGGGGFSGGGGFGGGSFGGNNNGGGFGGSHHHGHHHHGHHHHRPFFGGWGWGWGPVYGGFGGGLIAILIIALFIFFGIVWLVGEPDYSVNEGPVYVYEDGVIYDEGTMQDYANTRYKEVFGAYGNYEDNILLVFLTNEEADGYYTIAWVGDNIKTEINEMFGEYSEYGKYLTEYINTDYYAYTLDMNLSDVVTAMTKSISEAKLGSSFRVDYDHDKAAESRLYNYDTRLDISKEVVDDALQKFTTTTGIPCVIVVDSAERVFGAEQPSENAATEIIPDEELQQGQASEPVAKQSSVVPYIVIAVLVIVIIALVIIMKSKKKPKTQDNNKQNDMPWES